jgi:hypothetical protein
MSEETSDRRQKAAKEAKRQLRLAEEMKANMRKRKQQGKAIKARSADLGKGQVLVKDDGEKGQG